MIVIFDEFLKQPFKMILAKHYYMVKQLATLCPNVSLYERILPRTSVRCTHFRYAAAFQKCSYSVAIDFIIVTEEIFWL
ncbi:MAG TPA: hypothetical protein VMX36_11585 [Sedimentisphaerales bacterium]|nr:hypothetical protein [Sedimentisphaerales bacterium]